MNTRHKIFNKQNCVYLLSFRSTKLLFALTAYIAVESFGNSVAVPFAKATVSGNGPSLSECASQLRRGESIEAAICAKTSAAFYAEANNPALEIKSLILLAEAQQRIGEYRTAARNLVEALELAKQNPNNGQVAPVLGALGNIHIALGPPRVAEKYLTEAASLAEQTQAHRLSAVILNNLGNHYGLQAKHAKALAAYANSARLAKRSANPMLVARALANAARVALFSGDPKQAKLYSEQAITQINAIADSHEKAYLQINIARTLGRLQAHFPGAIPSMLLQSHQQLTEAKEVATRLADPLAASYALGYLGELYENRKRINEALNLTRRALFQAQQVDENSSLYRWYWQAGRLYNALGERQAAIAAYARAVDLLQKQRHQMSVTYGTPEATFRESVGPVYQQYVDLLLKDAAETGDTTHVKTLLMDARNIVEQLKAAELRDYFHDDCVDAMQAEVKDFVDDIESVSPATVVIYPILLQDRIELLLSFPEKKVKQFSVPVSLLALNEEVRNFRRLLEKRTTNEYRPHAHKLYQWLIEPFQSDLEAKQIKTLVFVPDGILRTIPMSALYDGRHFLIEKYAVAVTPGIKLTDPQPLDREAFNAVYGGLSKSVRGFPPLAHVPRELQSIQQSYGGTLLLDEEFQQNRLRQSLSNEQLNVLHIATHAQFQGDIDNSFLLTFDGRLTINQLADYVGMFRFREKPLELLVLSACETAQGDDRAALGLSGVAIKAGARSALGALWKVNDVATSHLISDFYQRLKDPKVSRAVALQRAQRDLIDDLSYRHPGYWSAFILLNSWL